MTREEADQQVRALLATWSQAGGMALTDATPLPEPLRVWFAAACTIGYLTGESWQVYSATTYGQLLDVLVSPPEDDAPAEDDDEDED